MGDIKYQNSSHYNIYRKLYPGEVVLTEFQLDNEASFKYCLERQFFVLIIPYTSDGYLLLERTFFQKNLKWSLPGDGLRPSNNEDFLYAAYRTCSSYGEKLKLADVTPFAFLENDFHFKETHHTHRGIGFIGRLRNDKQADQLRDRGCFVPLELNRENIYPEHNASIFPAAQTLIRKRLEQPVTDFDSEIETTESVQSRFRRHNQYIKPVVNTLSNIYGSISKEGISKTEFNNKIRSLIKRGDPQSFIDVACGDSSICKELSCDGGFKFVVANDVAFNQMSSLQRQSSSNLVYTNHDARNMPFKDKTFDVAFIKNVLHHMLPIGRRS